MIKGGKIGRYSCVSKAGNPKSAWDTQDKVIAKAAYLNKKIGSKETKLVGYKCSFCHKYHLTTVPLKNRKI